jgi:maltooligosyltrehalose trehalohydrolase
MEFLGKFRSIANPDVQELLPDPGDPATFEASRLDPAERERGSQILSLHKDLLRLRREDEHFRAQRRDLIHGAIIGPEAFVLRYFSPRGGPDCRLLVVNLGRDLFPNPTAEPLMAPPRGRRWEILWYSEHPRYGGCGAPPFESDTHWRIPGRAAVVLRPVERREGG